MKKKHPGYYIKKLFDQNSITTYEAADLIGIVRPNLSLILNGKRGISPIMALRLEKVFGIDAKTWLLQQLDYDLALAKKEFKEKGIRLKKISKADLK